MVNALLFGENRTRHGYADGLRRTLVGVVVAALLAASCIGYSFVRHAMAQARVQDQQNLHPSPAASATNSVTPYPGEARR